ncbi:carbohydrate ABC transporter permease [Cohnella cellulosilytica]|uniref:Carbohydrate ABC transporter permease n=1 Tax=Cohnella cellulosilytica TaxID=986710 RepID=A0ABW2FGV0_9BACL
MKRYAMSGLKSVSLGIYLILMVFPLLWVAITSLKPQKEIFTYPIRYWPDALTWQNYADIIRVSKFQIYIANSLLVALTAALIVSVISVLSAYVMARFNFRGHGQIMLGFFLTQMLPGFVSLGPLYMLMTRMDLINTRFSLILMYTVGLIPFSTILLKGFFERIPKSLEEAAMIDGCSRLMALVRVILPVMINGITATFIFAFVQNWNELFMAVMFIDNEALKTLPVAMNSFVMKFDIDWGAMSAGTMMSVIPTVVLFAIAQRFIVEGLTQGAVKG